jgi:CheY-like chemotaxis protein
MQDDKEACQQAGMDDFISKPIELEKLLATLEKWATTIKQKASVN